MRVSTSMSFAQTQRNIARQRGALAQAESEISTGRRLQTLAQDPSGARSVLGAQASLRGVGAQRNAVAEADHLLTQTEDVLADVEEALLRVHELTVQMASDSHSAADRQSAMREIDELRQHLLRLANSESGGRHLFAGLASAGPPFDPQGAYVGDTGHVDIPLGGGVVLAATVEGGGPFLDPGGGPSVFDTLNALDSALGADSGSQVGGLLDDVQAHLERSTLARQGIGYGLERLEYVREGLDRAEDAAQLLLSEERDTDMADAVLRLRGAESSLQAAYQLTARLDGLSLLSFLGS